MKGEKALEVSAGEQGETRRLRLSGEQKVLSCD